MPHDPLDRLSEQHIQIMADRFPMLMQILHQHRPQGTGALLVSPSSIAWVPRAAISHPLLADFVNQSKSGTFTVVFPDPQYTLGYLLTLVIKRGPEIGAPFILLGRCLLPSRVAAVLPRREDLENDRLL